MWRRPRPERRRARTSEGAIEQPNVCEPVCKLRCAEPEGAQPRYQREDVGGSHTDDKRRAFGHDPRGCAPVLLRVDPARLSARLHDRRTAHQPHGGDTVARRNQLRDGVAVAATPI